MTPINLYEAYAAVYDEDLRQELLVVEDDLSFVDDLSDNELVQIMEEIFTEGEFDLNECVELLDSEFLSEASRVDMVARAARRKADIEYAKKGAKEARDRERSKRRAERVERIKSAAKRVGERLAAPARSTGGTSASARVGQASKEVKSATEKVKGFLKGVRDTVSGAAKKTYDRVSGKEAKRTALKRAAYARRKEQTSARVKNAVKADFESSGSKSNTGSKPTWKPGGQNVKRTFKPQEGAKPTWKPGSQNVKRTFKPQEGAKSASGQSSAPKAEPEAPKRQKPGKSFRLRPSDPWRGSATTPSRSSKPSTTSTRALSGTPERKALPASGQTGGSTKRGKLLNLSQREAKNAGMLRRATNVNASYEMIADMIAEQLVSEGYAYDIIEAYDIILEMDDINIDEIVESVEYYLTEGYDEYEIEEETFDVYDVVLEHLLDEGYADSIESAESIMANMSEEWRDEIIDEAQIMSVSGPGGLKHMINRNVLKLQNAASRERQERQAKEKSKKEAQNAERLDAANKRGIEAATNRSNDGAGGNRFVQASSLRANERDDQPTNYRARRRRASGR